MHAPKGLDWSRLDCLQPVALSISISVIGILALGELKGKFSEGTFMFSWPPDQASLSKLKVRLY